jgi:hypothetical protein
MNRTVLAIAASAALTLVAPANASSLLVAQLGGNVAAFDASTGASHGVFATYYDADAVVTNLAGDVLVTGYNGSVDDVVSEYSPTGASLGNFATTGLSDFGLAAGPDGSIYVLGQTSTDYVYKYDGSTGAYLGQAVPSDGYYSGLAIASNNDIVMDDSYSVDVYSSAGSLLKTIGLPQLSFGVTVAADGDIFASSAGSIYNATGEVYVCRGCLTGSGSFTQLGSYTTSDSLQGLLLNGNTLYVAGRFDSDVLEFNTTTGAESTFVTGANGAYALALIPSDGPFGSTPEPGSWVLFGSAMGALALRRAASHLSRAGRRRA